MKRSCKKAKGLNKPLSLKAQSLITLGKKQNLQGKLPMDKMKIAFDTIGKTHSANKGQQELASQNFPNHYTASIYKDVLKEIKKNSGMRTSKAIFKNSIMTPDNISRFSGPPSIFKDDNLRNAMMAKNYDLAKVAYNALQRTGNGLRRYRKK